MNEKSQTPICAKNTYPASTGDADDYSPDFVPLEVAQLIELAASAMAEELLRLVDEKVDYMRRNQLGDPDIQFTVIWARQVLARWSKLKGEK